MALREIEERYQALIRTARAGFLVRNVEGRLLEINDAFCSMLGYPKETLLSMRISDLDCVETPEEVRKHAELIMLRGWDRFETKHRRADGKIIDVEVSVVRNADRAVLLSFINDITERKRGEREREVTMEFLRLMNQTTGTRDLVQKAATFFQERFGNDAVGVRLREGDDYPYFEVRGFPEEFVQSETSLCSRNCDGEIVRDTVGNPVLACMCGNVICGRFDPSKPFFTPGGSFWTNSTTQLLSSTNEKDRMARTRNRCNGEGYESVALISLRLGTERMGLLQLNDRRKGQLTIEVITLWERLAGYLAVALAKCYAEEALREEKVFTENALNTLIDTFFVFDPEGRFLRWNRALKDVSGYSDEEISSMEPTDFFPVEERTGVHASIERAVREGHAVMEALVLTKDGRKLPYEFTASHLRDHEGKIIGISGTGRDVTERKLAEHALRESKERYRSLFENMLEGYAYCRMLFEHDTPRDFTYIDVNGAFEKLTGLKNVVGKKVSEVIPGIQEANPELFEIYGRVSMTGKPERFETFLKSMGIWFSITAYSPEKGYFVAVFDNVTERKKAEKALQESEERFRELYGNAPVGYHEYDNEGRIFRVNQTELEMLGYTVEEMIGEYVWKFNVEEEIARGQILEKLSGSKPPGRSLELTYKRKDGTSLPVLLEDRLIRDGKGQITGIRCTIQDITERKKAEEALKHSEAKAMQLAQENAIMAEIGRIVGSTLDIDEVYESFTEEVKKIIPFDRIVINTIDTEKGTVRNIYIAGDGLQDRNTKDIYPLEGSGNAELVRTRSSLLIQTEDFSEYKDRFPNLLSTFQAGFRSIMNVPLFSKGKIIGGLLLRSRKPFAYTDMDLRLAERIGAHIAGAVANAQLYTERIHAEKERAAIEEQFRQSQKMEAIGALAGGVAHDFNNLLTVITGHCELLQMTLPENDPDKQALGDIHDAARRAASLTRQLLAFSRKQILEPKVLDLNEIVDNLEKMLRRLIGEDVVLTTALSPGISAVRVDPGQMEQVVINLAVNARDAMPQGGRLTIETRDIELTEAYCRLHSDVKPGRYALLSITDTGCGMTPEVKGRIFEPFFTTKGPGKGTGLGLATVFGIVKQSDGHIQVYSELGFGTCFKIYLAAVEAKAGSAQSEFGTGKARQGSETILLVEDEEGVRKIAKLILEKHGYKVLEASDGRKALAIAESFKGPIDLVLTDVVMPAMSGTQLMGLLHARHSRVKVLFMSGYTDDAMVRHGLIDAKAAFLHKPFSVIALAKKVREVLDGKSGL